MATWEIWWECNKKIFRKIALIVDKVLNNIEGMISECVNTSLHKEAGKRISHLLGQRCSQLLVSY